MIHIRSMLDAQLVHRALRCGAGLSVAELAQRLQISDNQVYTRENGRSGFGVDALVALGNVFGFDLAMLPRRGGTNGCCAHCRAVAGVLDKRVGLRRYDAASTPFAALYDAIAKAMGRRG